jgi:hypothetical protein
MALKSGDKIVAHTRLAVTDKQGVIVLFTPGEVITVGSPVTADQAQDWLICGSAAPFKPAPAAADPAA